MNRIKITDCGEQNFQFRIGRKWFKGSMAGGHIYIFRGHNSGGVIGKRMHKNTRALIETIINDNAGLLFDPFAWITDEVEPELSELVLPVIGGPVRHA